MNCSLDWVKIELELIRQSRDLSNSRDVRKMIKNIQNQVSQLFVT